MQGVDEDIDFLLRVIERKRYPRCCRNPEPLHHRLRAVMTGADGNTLAFNRYFVNELFIPEPDRAATGAGALAIDLGNTGVTANDTGDGVLKPTRTVCPECLRLVPGTTFQRDGRVYLSRECPEHGTIEALVVASRRHY